MPEWWVEDNGTNTLQGIPGDVNNPAVLQDEAILDFLLRIPEARASFNRLVPTMLPEEQARLADIARMADNGYIVDPIQSADDLMKAFNTLPVRRGGGWRPSSY